MGTGLTRSAAGSHSSLTPGWRDLALAGGRIALGAYWLWEQHWKLPPEFGVHDARGLMFSFQSSIEHPTLDLYKTFLQNVVVPHFCLFAPRLRASTDGASLPGRVVRWAIGQ